MKVVLAAAAVTCCGCRPDKVPTTQAAPYAAASASSSAATAPFSSATVHASVAVDGASAPPINDAGSRADREYRLGGTRLKLDVIGDRCALTVGDKNERTVRLDLAPPCYLLVWNHPQPRPPHNRAESGGQSIGSQGEPMAWKYATAGGATVVAIIGDDVAPHMRDSVFETRQAHNYRCAGSFQGVRLLPDGPRTTAKRNQSGVFCVEAGLDEKDFWMLAHDKPR